MAFQAKKLINDPNDVVTEFIEGLVETYPGLQYLDGFPQVKVVLRADVSGATYNKVAVISVSTWYQSTNCSKALINPWLPKKETTMSPVNWQPRKRVEDKLLHGLGRAFDNSPLHLTIEKLNGKNYREWAQAIKLVIDGKGKLGFLTGETRRPPSTDATASHKWRMMGCDTETYFDVENASQIFELKTRLWQMKQGDREVTEHYTEIRVLSRWPSPSIREVFSEVQREESRRKVMLREHLTSVPEALALVIHWKPRQLIKAHSHQASTGNPDRQNTTENYQSASNVRFNSDQLAKLYELFSNFQASGQSSTTLSSGSLAYKGPIIGKTISSAKECEGLYYFDEANVCG
ncbi:putative 3,4-dihydroxy-2-butanone kinase [Vitis vinifera]|uniref:Putative 3,4-dihydroxy-2-butanone kinase n=1 Tax=Vitis vinifera TaxID=29760 RepID=A0A438CWW9_VITVI|nr:putative 3,4-dihydroxy-2-butanone kinase [Vitis vinifera]